MDRDIDVRTPESVALTYDLAGLGSRFLALIVDQTLQIFALLAIFFAFVWIGSRVPTPAKHAAATAASSSAEKFGEAIVIALIVFVVFTILFGYFIFFEALWNGQTPGKKLLGIRVVRDGGYPLDFGASLVRNLIRVGEALIGYYVISAISTMASRENKRLGDLAAGTLVVRDERIGIPKDLREVLREPNYAPTTYLSSEERSIIKRFLERRGALDPRRRRELAAQLAGRIRDRVPMDLQKLDDEDLLERF